MLEDEGRRRCDEWKCDSFAMITATDIDTNDNNNGAHDNNVIQRLVHTEVEHAFRARRQRQASSS